jgi:hypothetical protein
VDIAIQGERKLVGHHIRYAGYLYELPRHE